MKHPGWCCKRERRGGGDIAAVIARLAASVTDSAESFDNMIKVAEPQFGFAATV